MSTSEEQYQGPLLPLRIEPATALTEISISDSRFRKIPLKNNSGSIELTLPPGVYQVGFRDGTSIQQQLVILSPDQELKLVRQEKAVSAPPERLDTQTAEVVPAQDTRGLVVVVRDGPDDPPSSSNRVAGLSLLAEGGSIVSAADISVRDASTLLSFDVTPGRYRLRLSTGLDDQAFETPLVICPGWGMRVYCRSRPYQPGDHRVDLSNIEIAMHPAGSTGRSREARELETSARAALAGGRTLSGPAFEILLRDKFLNPMFGLYAGYLLRGAADELETLAELVQNTDRMLKFGPHGNLPAANFEHPDIEALKLRLRLLRKEPIEDAPSLPFPPMLVASWRTILQVASHSKKIIPEGSLADRISSHLVTAGASMIWTVQPGAMAMGLEVAAPRTTSPEAGAPRRTRRGAVRAMVAAEPVATPQHDNPVTTIDLKEGIRVIGAALHDERLRNWFRTACGLDAGSKDEQEPQIRSAPIINDAGRIVAQAIHPIAPTEQLQTIFERTRVASGAEQHAKSPSDLAVELRLPVTTVERAIQDVSRKLLEQGQLLGVDLRERSTMARPELIIPYDPDFLGDGFTVPIPSLSDALRANAFAGGAVLDYTHFSLIMHARRRVAIVTAHNVDASRTVRVGGGLTWRMDERAGDNQLGPETYNANQLDKGHLVRREDVLWGTVPEAKLANKATYFYTNAAPQHKNFNQDEWVTLEDWVLDNATDFSYRLCVFTGPVLRSNDPVLTDLPPNLRTIFRAHGKAQIPAAFWKVVVLRDAEAGGEDLSVVCFAMRQSEMWNDREGRRLLSLKVHQVTLDAIERWTGLDFGDLKDADELAWSEERTRAVAPGEEPEWPLVRGSTDIVYSGPARRLRGVRAVRGAANAESRTDVDMSRVRDAGDLRAAGDCGCSGDGETFDAREAIAALSQEVARLTEVVAAQAQARPQEPTPEEPPTRGRSVRTRGATPAPTEADRSAVASEDERVKRMVDAAPDDMKEAVETFARTVVMQHDVARGVVAVPPPSELERIVGGNRVQRGAIPSCVCIGDSTGWFCTGVIVAPQVVLTAAHCGAQITRILVGDEAVPNLQGRIVAVRRAVIHPNYRRHPRNENDINVLILNAPAAVPPARLATAKQLKAATTVHLVGFGYNDPRQPRGFGIKREVKVPMGPLKRSDVDDLSAFESLTGFHADYEFVAGRKGLGKDSCNGDSGGPAYIDTSSGIVVAGLTSRATRDANVPCGAGGIYVRTDFFREWVNGVLSASGLPALPG